MTEMKIIAGKHKCKRNMEMRILPVDNDKKEIFAWIIYGICKKCEVVLMSALFIQKEKPIQNVDFIIDFNQISKEINSKKLKEGK